jgi:hypothetical protein
MRRRKPVKETDLYAPVAKHLQSLGFTVRGEVNACDIAAVRGEELVIVELKRGLTMDLLVQATKRQRMTDSVYVAIPRPRRMQGWHGQRRVLRQLALGLIFVRFYARRKPAVEVAFHPVPYQKQKRKAAKRAVLTEMEGRSGDFNVGGSTRRKLVTAYRENALQIACFLDAMGPMTPKELRGLGTGPKTQSILYSDFYGWFERVDRGVYGLKPAGREELKEYAEVVVAWQQAAGSHT